MINTKSNLDLNVQILRQQTELHQIMKKNTIHDNLLEAIKNKVPQGTNIAKLLMDILLIGKEAVYRRLRGEVPFTMEESAMISKVLGISLDIVVNENTPKSRSFQLKLTDFVNPAEEDYGQMEEFLGVLNASRNHPYTEVGSAANAFPQALFLRYKSLSKFYMFKWLYQWDGVGDVKSLDDIKISQRQEDIQKRYLEESMCISHTYYVWDNLIFHYLVNEIKYFANIRFITHEDVLAIKEDLHCFVNDLESLATKGRYETGNKIQFYLSGINFESTYSYLHTEDINLSHIKLFTLSAVVSLDIKTFEKVKNWVQSVKRLSTLISESGEMQRVQFFKKQRTLINSLV